MWVGQRYLRQVDSDGTILQEAETFQSFLTIQEVGVCLSGYIVLFRINIGELG